ncbi:MAG: hypothetical protein ACFB12_13210 [Leptolyngbyaceae cyanobacterium]
MTISACPNGIVLGSVTSIIRSLETVTTRRNVPICFQLALALDDYYVVIEIK